MHTLINTTHALKLTFRFKEGQQSLLFLTLIEYFCLNLNTIYNSMILELKNDDLNFLVKSKYILL